ncbi:MAG: hypothetical protein WB809_06035 [Thermoplasmata archaeon]
MSWGPNTNYAYVGVTNQLIGESAFKLFIDYLKPMATYDFKVSAATSCSDSSGNHNYVGSLTSTWTMIADSSNAWAGIVKDAAGSVPTYYPMPVWVTCNLAGGQLMNWTGTTGSNGVYSVSMGSYSGSACGSFSIIVYNSYCITTPSAQTGYDGEPFQYFYSQACSQYSGPLWSGHFNETIVTYAPQWMHFVIPQNFISPYYPAVLDFSNAFNGYSTLQFETGTSSTLTTEMSYSWSIGGGSGPTISGSSTTSAAYTIGTSGGVESTNGPLDYIVQQETTGMVLFDAFDRAWQQTEVTLFGPFLNGEPAAQNPNFQQPSSWLTPGTSAPDVYYVTDQSVNKVMDDVYLNDPGFFYTGSVATSTTIASGGSYSISFPLTVSLPGVGSVSVSVGAGWSQTSSTTYSSTLSWSAGEINGGSAVCIDVLGEGGSGNYADMVGIIEWTPGAGGSCIYP